MRYISANTAPEALVRWKAERNHVGQALDFKDLGRVSANGSEVDVKAEIKKQRLMDQGYLCAYTMVRISESSSHIEHVTPQAVSRARGAQEETVEYGNMIACYPMREEEGGIPFGAAYRGNRELAIHPLDSRCERLVKYRRIGRVESSDDSVSQTLDHTLNLNHPTLVDRRAETFNRAGVGLRSEQPLTEKAAQRLADAVFQPDDGGKLPPFCIAVAHAALEHAEMVRERKRRKAMARKNNR